MTGSFEPSASPLQVVRGRPRRSAKLFARGSPRIALAPVAAVLLFAACGDDGSGAGSESADTVRLWVQPELAECEGGAGPQTRLLIAESEDGEATLFYDL